MSMRRLDSIAPWWWPVVFVTSLHCLTTSGGWWITDHGEILAVAHRFLATGHMDLRDLGPGWEDWTQIAAARGSTGTRFLPGSILSLTPFLALDHLFGWRDPTSFRFVHLQGHVFVSLGLALAGRFVARSSGRAAAAVLSILLLGLNWPVWMIARRLGPEPVLFALLALFATGGPRRKFLGQLLLPWIHASGPLLGLAALLALRVETGSSRRREIRASGLGFVLGAASVALFWNLRVHGHAVMGGYDEYRTDSFFTLRNPFEGLTTVVGPMLWWALPLWLVSLKAGRFGLRLLALWFIPVVFFSVFSNPEPERRLAPLLAVCTITMMPLVAPLQSRLAFALASLSLVSGAAGLSRDFVDVVDTPFGVFSGPRLMFVRLAFAQTRPGLAAVGILLTVGMVFLSGKRSLDQLVGSEVPVVDSSRSLTPECRR